MENVRLGCSSSSTFCQHWGWHEARAREVCVYSPWRALERCIWLKTFVGSAGEIGIFLGLLRFGTRKQVSPKVGRRRQSYIMRLHPALECYNIRQGDAGAMIKSLPR